MKPTRYPLDALIEMRSEELDRAQESFSSALEATNRARMGVEAARKGVQAVQRSIQELEEKFRSAASQKAVAAGFLESFPARRGLLDNRLAKARAALGEAQRLLTRAQDQEEAARAALAEARKELEVVERHKEKWKQTRRAKRLAAEDELAEELAARRGPQPR